MAEIFINTSYKSCLKHNRDFNPEEGDKLVVLVEYIHQKSTQPVDKEKVV